MYSQRLRAVVSGVAVVSELFALGAVTANAATLYDYDNYGGATYSANNEA